ncbi:beta-galactosidase [Micromonospora sp. SL1-18]|uniref:beta-galactosidase n=1 Tax=Micromonospora sp. SL1-18 TaxID=3399128 RepID=UPI003A4DD172
MTFDKYSLMLDGQRTYIWSGEFHSFRLPSPDLWRDVLQKMKAEGYNAVSLYFDWAYHSPKPGVYDFTGVRDLDKLLDIAEEAGLYVIARPGPYINAETSGGGFPGWLTTQAGKARSDAADYLAASDEWLGQVDAILARHQYTNGTGPVILYQIENELATTGSSQKRYMQHLYDKVRADGITVPIFHNDKGRNGVWVPSNSDVPGTVTGPNDLYAFDGYGGGSCRSNNTPGSPTVAPDWGIWGSGGAKGGSTASPNTPGFVAERGGGWFDYWGGPGSYECMSRQEGPGYERVTYGTDIANRLSIHNVYMTFGGTSWGWLPAPVVYSSYDYGAAISEARQIRPKATTMKELGLFLQSVEPMTKVDKGSPVTPSNSAIKIYNDVNPDTGTHFYVAMHNPSNATTNDAFSFPITTADGTYTVPQQGTLRINGQDSKILTADYDLDAAAGSTSPHLVYSTSQIMTHLNTSTGQLALLYAPKGEDGETVLRYDEQPKIQVLTGSVSSSYDTATGDLRLNYAHDGLAEVRITAGGREPLTLLLADTDTAGTFWQQDTSNGPVLIRGPELVRTATVRGASLHLTGDTKDAADLEAWTPTGISALVWNGDTTPTTTQPGGSLLATAQLPGAVQVKLPDLSTATWKTTADSEESAPGFDDSAWQVADKTTTNSTTKPPAGQPVLTADDYGFHQGDVWYRGHYTGGADASTIAFTYGGGGAGMLQAWLDGVYLGQDVLNSGQSSPPTRGTVTFAVPAGLRTDGAHVLSVMVRNNGHNEDGGVNDAHKEGRGLIAAMMNGAAAQPEITWRVQGNLGGEDIVDPTRGVMNAGGLYGERHGWQLPGYPDDAWASTTLPQSSAAPGTTWYRTHVSLDVPVKHDSSIGITIGDPSKRVSDANYRALIYVNGWNIGQYIANVGPQHTFVVPTGVLDPQGDNTIAVAVTSDGGPGNGPESVALTDLGTVRGGVKVKRVAAPNWNAKVYGQPTLPGRASVTPLTSVDAPAQPEAGDSFTVAGAVRNDTREALTEVDATLDVPSGWTATPIDQAPATLASGESAPLSWRVNVGDDAAGGAYALAALVAYHQGDTASRTGSTYPITLRQRGLVYVSDLPFVSATNGYGPVERDTNVGGNGAGDGTPITIRGVTYAKGLGTNAISSVVLDLGGRCTSFSTDVGVDDSAGGKGTVTFTVLADGKTVASTGVMTGTAAAKHLTADVTGVQQLTLQVGDAGDGNGHDNADWAGAQLMCNG